MFTKNMCCFHKQNCPKLLLRGAILGNVFYRKNSFFLEKKQFCLRKTRTLKTTVFFLKETAHNCFLAVFEKVPLCRYQCMPDAATKMNEGFPMFITLPRNTRDLMNKMPTFNR